MHLLADILGKKNTQRLNGKSVSHLLITALLGCSALTTGSVVFNQHVAAIAQEQSVSFSISAQPLSSAIREFIAMTGWQISYSSDAVAGKRSSGVSGNMSPEAALRKLISGTGLQLRKRSSTSVALLPFGSNADASPDSELLDEVVVYANSNPSNTESLFGDGDPSAIGKTTISRSLIETGGDAGGDINSQLKTLPNVQWQDHTDDDAGDTATSEQDLTPGRYSISGGDVDANLFLLDGVNISTRDNGEDEHSNSRPLHDRSIVLLNAFDALHPQVVYVPDAVIERMTVHESNISARYGGFQGGVVELETLEPTADRWSGFLSMEGTSSHLTKFNVATKDGKNPEKVKPYEFLKLNGSIGVSGPLADGLSFISSYTHQYGDTKRDRSPQFIEQKNIETHTNSTTFLNKIKLERDWGVLTLSNTTNFYDQYFEPHLLLADKSTLTGDGSSSSLKFEKDLNNFGAFSNVAVTSETYFNTSQKGTESDGSESFQLNARTSSTGFSSSLSDKCRDIPTARTVPCNFGSQMPKLQEEVSAGTKLRLEADWKDHHLALGGGFSQVIATRKRLTDFTHYSGSPTNQSFDCVSGSDDPFCHKDEIYTSFKILYPAYDNTVTLSELNLWGEVELNFGAIELRPGVRIDYDSYLKNINVAPRLSASLEIHDRFTLTGGFNRYYDNAMLSYALKAAEPDAIRAFRRAKNGVVSNEYDVDGGWTSSIFTTTDYQAHGLRTPYNDEITFGASFEEPLLDGILRLKFLSRHGRDRFSSDRNSPSKLELLDNSGSSKYQSISLEYAKTWTDISFGPLDRLGFKLSTTWSPKNHKTNDDIFDIVETDKYAYYDGKSYRKADFDAITGDRDIPFRAGLRFEAGLFEERLKLWGSANFTLPYDGVIINPEESKHDVVIDGETIVDGGVYYIDKHYDFTTFLNVGGSYKLAETKYGETILSAKINNLFNEVGNSTTNHTKPFKKGRQFWLGLKTSF